jgi:hypothetical protein
MAKNDDAVAIAGIALGLVGIGLLAKALTASSAAEDRRSTFLRRLSTELTAYDVRIVNAAFGRGPRGEGIWHVTAEWPHIGTDTMRVRFRADEHPYSDGTLHALVNEAANFS